MKKSAANVDIVTGMMLFLILAVTVFLEFKLTQYMVTAANVEDALAVSNLASAIIDVEEYGKSHHIWITDCEKAFHIYRDALGSNLKLDGEFNSSNNNFLVGPVKIRLYSVYNVIGDAIEIHSFDGYGNEIALNYGKIGEVFTPDNVPVEHTTIYSKISFQVQGPAGLIIPGEKEKSIDIVRCNSE